MPYYYFQLRQKFQLPVLPIALFLKVGLEGVSVDVYEEQFWDVRPLRFEYLYVALPGLDAVQYLEGGNPLGVALSALMKIPNEKIVWLGAEALRRISGLQLNDQQKFLLCECVEAYLPANDDQKSELDGLLETETYKGVKAMNVTTYEKGQRSVLLEIIKEELERRFESDGMHFFQEIDEDMSTEKLNGLRRAVVTGADLVRLREMLK